MKKNKLRILLIGYGKMGKAIETIALKRGHSISAIISDRQIDLEHICRAYQPNIAFEFTSPSSAPGNLQILIEAGIPIVCGSTGWMDKWQEIKDKTQKVGGTLFYASNFSPGMNLAFKLVEMAGRFFDEMDEYEVDIEEIHHTEKKDIPSGTAITLAQKLIGQMKSKSGWEVNQNISNHDKIAITAIREPDVPGTHTVSFSSSVDTIEICHTAHSRHGFALGAVQAAEWVLGRKGVFTMEDFLKEKFQGL
jgi:4-hydroxy-tetrahydrodipicolinate reductase